MCTLFLFKNYYAFCKMKWNMSSTSPCKISLKRGPNEHKILEKGMIINIEMSYFESGFESTHGNKLF
jgi:hypothetical protein